MVFGVYYGMDKFIIAGIHKHFLYGTLSAAVGYWINGNRNSYLAEKDAILRHYVELHPADFPTPGL